MRGGSDPGGCGLGGSCHQPKAPKFKDHMPYSNRGMEDLLEQNKIASAIKTEIILPRSNKTIQACTPLVLTGTKMNVMTEPLHWTDKALSQRTTCTS